MTIDTTMRETLAPEETVEQLPTRRSARAEQEGTAPKDKGLWQYLAAGLSAGVLGFIVLIAVLVIVIPMASDGRALTVLTGSMDPTYPPGTLVVVTPTEPADIRVGDVMTYQLESGKAALVTHRVVGKVFNTRGDITFTTKGDANDSPDPAPVQEIQIVGTVAYAVPYLGWVNNAINGELRGAIVPIVVGLLFAYAAWMVVSGIRDRRKARA